MHAKQVLFAGHTFVSSSKCAEFNSKIRQQRNAVGWSAAAFVAAECALMCIGRLATAKLLHDV